MKIIAQNMSFGYAFEELKNSKKELGMRLPNWDKSVIVKIQYPNEKSKMTAPYLYVQSKYGRVPWRETQVELFSECWEIVEIK